VDQLKGKWLQFKGEVKKQWGKLIDDDLRQIEGTTRKSSACFSKGTGLTASTWFGSGTAGKSTNSYNGVAGGYNDLSRKSRKRRRV